MKKEDAEANEKPEDEVTRAGIRMEEKNKAISLKPGIIFPIVLMIAIFVMKKGDKQNAVMEPQGEIQEAEWQVKEDDTTARGSNLFYGSSMAEGNNSVYVLDIGRYSGKPVGKDERCIVYQMKRGEWETFASELPLGSWDIRSISNLVYWDGYIYYALKEVNVRTDGTEAIDNYIYRISEDAEYDGLYGRPQDWILTCDMNFYIYEDKIYFKFHEKGTRYFYKAELNGEDKEVLYADEQEDASAFDYTVGGGCLYIKDGKKILGINLKTGERKSFQTGAEHLDGMFYENGRLYIYDSENGEVCQIDVMTGSESKLVEGKIFMDCVWIHDGYLYYVEGEEETDGFCCKLKAMNVMTGEAILWESVSFDIQPCDAGLEVVEDCAAVSFCEKKGDGIAEYKYVEKEVSEITDAGNMKIREILCREEKGEKRTVVVQEGCQEGEWQMEQDDEAAIGYNFENYAISTVGNGCIYSMDMEMYEGEPSGKEGVDNDANIYRLKDGKWELFASHPAIEEDPWWAEISVRDLTYYNGYLYYILLRDYEPGMGSSGKNYFICRISEHGGDSEELVECNGSFYIYQDKIYYDSISKGRHYFRMKPDGSGKELIYFDAGEEYYQFAYAVGGDCLYFWNKEQIVGISLESDKKKILTYFDAPAKCRYSIFYEDGKLYIYDVRNPIIYQLNVKTGEG